jgi:L-threonylcarbamoyladenylate synthase
MLITQNVGEAASLVLNSKGSVIAYPTETFYGLGARISDHNAIGRIIALKGRGVSKGMIVLASSLEIVAQIAVMDERQRTLLERFWPGPLSAVLQAKENIDHLLAPDGKIAVRISPHRMALSLVEKTGPITSTSANVSGKPPARTLPEVLSYGLDLDGILDGGETAGGRPSTLINLTVWPPVCLRKGHIPFNTILL